MESWQSILNPERKAWRFLAILADFLMLGLLWILFSLPLFTFGAASTALYDAVYRSARQDERRAVTRFLQHFRSHWKAAALPGLLFLFYAGLFFAYRLYLGQSAPGGAASLPLLALFFGLMIGLGLLCWVFPMLSRFELSTPQLLKNALFLGLRYAPVSFLLGLSLDLAFVFFLQSYLWIVPIFCLPPLLVFAWSFLLEPFFQIMEERGDFSGLLTVLRQAYLSKK